MKYLILFLLLTNARGAINTGANYFKNKEYLSQIDQAIDTECGDTWCEGDFNLLDVLSIYQKSTDTLRVYMSHQMHGPHLNKKEREIFYSVCVLDSFDYFLLDTETIARIVSFSKCTLNDVFEDKFNKTIITKKEMQKIIKEVEL